MFFASVFQVLDSICKGEKQLLTPFSSQDNSNCSNFPPFGSQKTGASFRRFKQLVINNQCFVQLDGSRNKKLDQKCISDIDILPYVSKKQSRLYQVPEPMQLFGPSYSIFPHFNSVFPAFSASFHLDIFLESSSPKGIDLLILLSSTNFLNHFGGVQKVLKMGPYLVFCS